MIVYVIGVFATAAISATGGWLLRGMLDQHRAEVARDCKWDRDHGG